jgi:hypothetical protein
MGHHFVKKKIEILWDRHRAGWNPLSGNPAEVQNHAKRLEVIIALSDFI